MSVEFTINDKDEFPPVLEFGIVKKVTLHMNLSTSFTTAKASVTLNDTILQPKAAESTTQTGYVVSYGHNVFSGRPLT